MTFTHTALESRGLRSFGLISQNFRIKVRLLPRLKRVVPSERAVLSTENMKQFNRRRLREFNGLELLIFFLYTAPIIRQKCLVL